MIDKKTKIICTIADNKCDEQFIRDLYENGMNILPISAGRNKFKYFSFILGVWYSLTFRAE